ncbi:MAG: hypothetical protein GXO86_02675 [Chlorobi bacterium]|nr:hypothetical protein [Chlorobiota bacterium]
MRFLFDQNISHKILKYLPGDYSGSTTVKKEKLINASDKEIWEYAKKFNYIIVTQDSDFNELTSLYGFPPKIIWIRTGNIKTQVLVSILLDYAHEIKTFTQSKKFGCFEIFNIK